MWVNVSREEDFTEGKALTVEAAGSTIAVFRAGGEYRAIAGVCPHRGGPLAEGTIEDGAVVCPWHAWKFNLSTGDCPAAPAVRARTYPVKITEGSVWVDAG